MARASIEKPGMKPAYVVVIAAVALAVGYVAGIAYGRQDEGDAWRRAVAGVPSDACRHEVREAFETGPFRSQP